MSKGSKKPTARKGSKKPTVRKGSKKPRKIIGDADYKQIRALVKKLKAEGKSADEIATKLKKKYAKRPGLELVPQIMP